jgi:hypothetical protein
MLLALVITAMRAIGAARLVHHAAEDAVLDECCGRRPW